jgi:hypothetical protein
MEKQAVIDFVKENLNDVSTDDNKYLYFISVYLESLYNEDEDNFEVEFKNFLPSIKKAIKNLQNNFDSVFLLIFEKSSGLFKNMENKNLFDTLDFLVEKLGERNFINEAEKLNHLKVKFSLGYERYFIFAEKDIFIKSINQITFNFELYSKFDLDNEFEVLRVLDYYLDVKNYDKEGFRLFLDYLEDFPLKIYRNDNLDLFDIQKSLFFYSDFDELEFDEGIIKTCQFYSIDVAVKILQVMNFQNE